MRRIAAVILIVSATSALLFTNIHSQAATPSEVLSKRTQTSKTYYLGGNKYSMDTKIGSVHYRNNPEDTTEPWKEINNQLVPAVAPWDWQMIQDGYKTYILNSFTAGQVLKFESQGSTVAFQPMGLLWTNNLDQLQQISMPVDVNPAITNTPVELLPSMPGAVGTIRWDNAYGAGRHFEWTCSPGRLNKILQLDVIPPAPPQYILNGGNPVLKLDFIFAPSSDLDIYIDGQLWDKSSKRQTVNNIEFRRGSEVLWVFTPIKYWGSDFSPESLTNENIGIIELSKVGNKLYISALVPYTWLQMAIYPVFIDPPLEVQVGASADDGYVTNTGGFNNTNANQIAGILSGNQYHAFHRFTGITIPQSTTIDVAYLTFYEKSSVGSPQTKFYADDQNDPTAVANNADYYNRALTTAGEDYDNDPGAAGWYNTGSIVSVIQELVNSYDYSNEAIQLLQKYDGGGFSDYFLWRSYNDTTDPANTWGAILHLEWEAGGEPAFIPVVTIW